MNNLVIGLFVFLDKAVATKAERYKSQPAFDMELYWPSKPPIYIERYRE